jgi:CDGSH-type Zn-finger protein
MDRKRIVVQRDGPYVVHGNVPLVRKAQVVSEYGEPLTWRKEETLAVPETYLLCRCGHSQQKPFCDGTHREIDFDGTETADTGLTAERQVRCEGGSHIEVKSDASLCMNSGFCRTRQATIEQLVPATEDMGVRSQVIAMVEHCPSGSLTYSVDPEGPAIEPDLPQQVAVTTEITSQGPIEGPLWVTGSIPIERADGQPFETRNRVTLCSCGLSRAKPLCDGAHRPAEAGEAGDT